MITSNNEILCIPKTQEVKHIGMTGMTGCQPAGSKVLMANGSWKNIEDIKIGDLIISPQKDGIISRTKVINICSWKSNENYNVCDENNEILYKCSNNHIIPIFNDNGNFLFNKEAKDIDSSTNNYSLKLDEGEYPSPIKIYLKKLDNSMVYGFEIDSPSKWYITDNWMVTHNTCKSVFINSMLSWDYWHLKRDCINLNDFQKETFEWSLPTNSFIDTLKIINTKPFPTPMIYVFPSTRTLQIERKDRRFHIVKMTLPVEEVIRNVEHFFKLDKSKVYLGNLIEELVDCDSIGEIRSVLEENIHPKHTLMKNKLMNIFEALFNNNMLNVSSPEAPAFLKYKNKNEGKKYYNLTIQTLIKSGLIPSIQTSDLRNQDYFAAYISFIVESLYKNQYEDIYFKDRSISLFVDEIDKLWQGNNGGLIKSSLSLIGTNGRAARIGIRWSTQHYLQVPDQIRGNTKYLFVSRKSHAKEVNEIRKDFDIPKEMEKEILNLKTDPKKGIFEIVALTTERFVIYDLKTGKITNSSGAKKGQLIPSPAQHMVPNNPI